MTTATVPPGGHDVGAPDAGGRGRLHGRSELGLAALLGALGAFVLVETSSIDAPVDVGAVGPRFFPTVVGVVLCVVGAWLAVDVLRGGGGQMEQAEDVDTSRRSDWRTLALLSAAFLLHAAVLDSAGFPVAGALLFFGVAAVLGSRRYLRDAAVAVVLSVGVFLVFARGLGVGLPAGVLEGVL